MLSHQRPRQSANRYRNLYRIGRAGRQPEPSTPLPIRALGRVARNFQELVYSVSVINGTAGQSEFYVIKRAFFYENALNPPILLSKQLLLAEV
jgi:hypothetical protein